VPCVLNSMNTFRSSSGFEWIRPVGRIFQSNTEIIMTASGTFVCEHWQIQFHRFTRGTLTSKTVTSFARPSLLPTDHLSFSSCRSLFRPSLLIEHSAVHVTFMKVSWQRPSKSCGLNHDHPAIQKANPIEFRLLISLHPTGSSEIPSAYRGVIPKLHRDTLR
jgi:hypothetical protein